VAAPAIDPGAPGLRPPPASTVEPMSLPRRVRQLRAVLGGVLVLALVGIVVATYYRIEQELQATLRTQLNAVLSANVRSARTWLDEQTELARRLAAETSVARAAAAVVRSSGTGEAAAAAEFERVTRPFRIAARVGEIRVLEPGGRARTGTGTFPLLSPALLSRLRERGTLSLFPDMGGGPRGELATLAVIGDRRAPEGILALVVEPERLPGKLRAATWGKSGETFAFSSRGTFVTAPRFEPLPTHGGPPPLAKVARSAHLNKSGVDVDGYLSYRGTRVVGAWQWLDAYELGIATQVAHREAHESVLVLRIAFVVLSALVGAALLGFLGIARWSLRVRQDAVLVSERLGRLGRTISALSAALENDPTAVLLVDEAGTVVYANASSHRVLRVHVPLVGHPVSRALVNLPPELQAALDSGSDSIASGAGASGEDETLLVSSRDLRIHGQPHVLFMLRPITQQVRRQELDHWRNLLRVLSHELNNSLAPITSLVSSARKVNAMGSKDAQLDRIFDAIAERTARLLAFLESYRTIARLPMPAKRDVDFRAFVDGLAYQAPFRTLGPTPTSKGYFDPVQMERVLLNLIKNSAEAGSRTEDIELCIAEDGDNVRIDVLDRGSGMSERVLKQAMLPFFSTKEGGTGVGLALAREVVEAHGGRMVLANREGGGLVVSMYLPSAPPPPSRGSLSRLRVMEKSSPEPASEPKVPVSSAGK